MRKSIINKFTEYFPSFLSGIMIVLSFPTFDFYLLAWIAFVPLLLSLWGKNSLEAFLSGYVFGLTYFFGTLYWIYHSINHYGGFSFFSSVTIVLLLCCYLSLYPAVFSLVFLKVIKKTKLPGVFIAPVLWVVLEFIRSYALTGFPWSSIGYSQYLFLPVIQISDITGIYGISFLVLSFNGALFDIILLNKRLRKMPLFPISHAVIGITSLIFVLIITLVYGTWRLGQERNGNTIKVGIIQGNIEQDKKWSPAFQQEVMNAYFSLSNEAIKDSPDILVWPETSVPFYFGSDPDNSERLVQFKRSLDAYLLFGSVMVNGRYKDKSFLSNSAVLLDKEGNATYKYDKIHLVPFGEYVPLRSILFFIDKLVAGVGDFIPGKKYLLAETPLGNFGTVICYEIIFPGLVRKMYVNGGDFMATITNDAWFGKTSGPYQHFSMSVFRAIENRKPLIRSANTGISGIIDSNGRILSMTHLFQRTVLTDKMKTDHTLTFYTKYGDLFSYFCIVMSILLLINSKLWR